jgi:methylated-DNA-[protein]-cysteine S-methyltransferase
MPAEVKVFVLESRLGPLYGAEGERGLVALTIPSHDLRDFGRMLDQRAPASRHLPVEPEATASGRQLGEYLAGRRQVLDAPLDLEGLSEFSAAVLSEVRRIPFGQTRTYGEVAKAVGRPGAARAVGQAVGANPVPIFVPCHRVVGAGGGLTGFGSGLATKRVLLDLEQAGRRLF